MVYKRAKNSLLGKKIKVICPDEKVVSLADGIPEHKKLQCKNQ